MANMEQVLRALGLLRTQVDETENKVRQLQQEREQHQTRINAIDAELERIAAPLVANLSPAAPPAPATAAPPLPREDTLQENVPVRRVSSTEIREKLLPILPPTTEPAMTVKAIRERLKTLGVPHNDQTRRRVNQVLKNMAAEGTAIARGGENENRAYQRNNTIPAVEAAAFVSGPPSLTNGTH